MQQNHNDGGLYESRREHDGCGMGVVVNIAGQQAHSILETGKEILLNLHHRGATGSDEITGDGAGILFQIPHEFFKEECCGLGITLPTVSEYGVGMVFGCQDSELRAKCDKILEDSSNHYGIKVLGWREVPTANDCPGPIALEAEPSIRQIFIHGGGFENEFLEQQMYLPVT